MEQKVAPLRRGFIHFPLIEKKTQWTTGEQAAIIQPRRFNLWKKTQVFHVIYSA